MERDSDDKWKGLAQTRWISTSEQKTKKSTRMQKQCVPQVSFPLASAEK